jgi:hypothetical protein
MSLRTALCLVLLILFASSLLVGCDDDDPVSLPGSNAVSTCEGCHTSEQMLKATALPDPPPPEDEGEG